MPQSHRRLPKSIRLDPEVIDRLERVRKAMSKKLGLEVNESDAYRAAIADGCARLEKKFGVKTR